MPGISERLLLADAPSHASRDSPEDCLHHAIVPGQVKRKGLGGHDTRTLLKIFPQQRSRPVKPGLDSFHSNIQAAGRLGHRHSLETPTIRS